MPEFNDWTIIWDSDGEELLTTIGETEMPARYCMCINCDYEIDTQYEDYHVDECGCCYRCDECYTRQNRRGGTNNSSARGTIHPYSYRPRRYNSQGNFPTEVLMGVELEVGGNMHGIANRVAEVDPEEHTLYCKSDCSIYGTEIVSHPFTLNWIKGENANGERIYDSLLEKLREDECFTDKADCQCGAYRNECDHEYGLHIHVSRNAFRQLRKRRSVPPEPMAENETYEQRIGRELRAVRRQQREQEAINHQMIWLMFLERNADKIEGDTKLARRVSEHYGAFKQSSVDELRRKSQDYPYGGEGRYTAINCQNEKTYELRFFKSTTDTEEFYAALEFADASVEFTRNIDASAVLRGRALEWSNFVNWINEQKTDTDAGVVFKYSNLISQINSLGLQ